MSYKHLSICERTALMLESGKPNFSPRQFAKQIKRHHSTIYRELKRHAPATQPYNADQALVAASAKRLRGHLKIDLQSTLWAFIVDALQALWSPQQIADHLKRHRIAGVDMTVSHPTIYATIRALPKGELKKELLSCLRHAYC